MQNDLDRLIDGTLAQYANPEPLAGLEQRVVARARASAARWRWWTWAAVPVAAAVLAVWVGQRKSEPVATLTIEWPAPPAQPDAKPRVRSRDVRGCGGVESSGTGDETPVFGEFRCLSPKLPRTEIEKQRSPL